MATTDEPALDPAKLEHRFPLMEMSMNNDATVTEAVVRHHLQAFLDQKPVADIVSDYASDAHFISETQMYRGTEEIHGFFTNFIAALPERAMERFTLTSLQVHRNIAYITWCVGSDIPLGTDTFIVDDGKIISQTFAMYAISRTTPTPQSAAGA